MADLTYKDLKDPWDDYYMKSILHGLKSRSLNVSDPPRLRSEGEAKSVRGFCNLIWLALKVLRPDTKFVPAFPPYVMNDANPQYQTGSEGTLVLVGADDTTPPDFKSIPAETITWMLYVQEPGAVGDRAFGTTREIKPRVREDVIRDEYAKDNETGEATDIVQTKAQCMDNIIQFDIWTKDNSSSEDLVEWFKKFMVDYEGIFQQNGIVKMHFDSRIRDEMVLKWRNGLVNRTLRWYVRTEEVWAQRISRIRQINLKVEKLKSSIINNWKDWTINDTTRNK